MQKSTNPYDRSVRSINDSDSYDFSGESEYSRERSDPYLMVDYMIDRGFDHRGKGPKGFTLTDDKIREGVREILFRDSRFDASEVEVEVKEGNVYLRGHVQTLQTKRLAELSIDNLPGVKDIINQLQISNLPG